MRLLFAVLALLAFVPVAYGAPPKKAVPARKAAPRDWTRVFVQTPAGGVRMGNPAAKVAIVEYGSRTCPHCALFATDGVPALKAKYVARGSVSYEFRDYPIHGTLDLGPILLGRCGGTARFFPLLDAMMAEQPVLLAKAQTAIDTLQGTLGDATPNAMVTAYAEAIGYRALVERRGVTRVRAGACLADRKALDLVIARANAAERDWKVSSTPTFIVNGKAVAVADWAGLEPLLRAAGAK